MTVETTTRRVRHVGNGATTSFTFSPMVIYQSTDLVVTLRDEDDVETVLTEGVGTSNYSVTPSGAYPSTGTITYPASGSGTLSADESLVITCNVPLKQLTDLENQGPYLAATQESAFDYVVHLIQQLNEKVNRALKLNVTDNASPDLNIPSLEASKYLRVNSGATGFDLVALSTTALAVSAFIETLLDDANAAAARTTLGAQALDTDLTAIAALVSAADKLPYATGSGTWALADFTAAARVLMAVATQTAARAALGVAWEILDVSTLSGAASKSYTTAAWFDGTYDELRWVWTDWSVGTDNVAVFLQVSTDGGSNWKSGASDYTQQTISGNGGGSTTSTGTPAASTAVTLAAAVDNRTTDNFHMEIELIGSPAAAKKHRFQFRSQFVNNTPNPEIVYGYGRYETAEAINGVLIDASGTISGKIVLMGRRAAITA